MTTFRRFTVAFGVTLSLSCTALAQQSPQIEPLLPELASPTAIAVRPGGNQERHELFVADADGRILRIASDALDQPQDVLTGYQQAPAALQFINGRTLVVASSDASPVLRAYEIPDDGKAIAADQSKFELTFPTGAAGTVTAMTVGASAIFVVGSNEETGWVLRSRVRSGVPGDLKMFVDTSKKSGGSRPTCAVMSTRGWFVVGDAGKRDAGEDSQLTFYHPTDSAAEPALKIEPALLDVAAIAYSPQGMLYAADFAATDPQRAGIYRIEMSFERAKIGGKVVQVVAVEHPTAMAFAPDGTLYVIARDNAAAENTLMRVTGVE